MGSGPHDYDYPSLNLTPFLTQNLNLLNNPNSAGNLSNNITFTPFYDKSIHLNDFFMDSPIRNTPLKIETITPSKFVIATDSKSSSRKVSSSLDVNSNQKRSLTLLDTPARQPFKKSGASYKHEVESDNEEDFNDMDSKKYDGDGFLTPSKKNILSEIPPNLLNKTPMKSTPLKNFYQTPGVIPNSSPSTVIMSSATKSPDQDNKEPLIPASPTPHKDIEIAEPVMGIFSEKKNPPKLVDSKANSKKPQKKQLAGMNRFQIVFTDVHTLMNNKKKKSLNSNLRAEKQDKKLEKRKASTKTNKTKPLSPILPYHPVIMGDPSAQHNLSSFQHTSSNLSASQDFNSTMNSSKEFSIIGNSTTFNTTANNINSSSDQNSFDLMHGGTISTPNGKYLLDNLFDEQSPQGFRQSTTGYLHPKRESLQQMPPPKLHNNSPHLNQHTHLQPQQLPSSIHRPQQVHQQLRQSFHQSLHEESQNQQPMTSFIMSTP